MSRLLKTAATGMLAQQLFIDTIANNLANVNTAGFKKTKVEFQDLLYQTIRAAGSSNLQGTFVPTELQVGSGTRPSATQRIISQGNLTQTNNDFDIAIDGRGFFQITKPDGTLTYTRDGSFKMSEQQILVTTDGFQLEPQITLPTNMIGLDIGADGRVFAKVYGQQETQELGQLQVALFANPGGMKAVGQNLFEATFASGVPVLTNPGVDGAGTILHKYSEGSNVDVVEEMVNMIIAQRSFETNSKAVQAADDMLNTSNNLRR